nr:MAG TPA: hypothetical protein [Caudoviricetes sp.]
MSQTTKQSLLSFSEKEAGSALLSPGLKFLPRLTAAA